MSKTVTAPNLPPDLSDRARRIWEYVQPFTMTGPERVSALIDAATHVSRCRIPGALVECGVWAGGSTMAMLMALVDAGETARDIYLYDTYEGMTVPTSHDVSYRGERALDRFPQCDGEPLSPAWTSTPLDEVRDNVRTTQYPMERVRFVQGRVEETIPQTMPDRIALLRLDTDWYESTRHELEHLYPLLSPGGILIIDDYGHWQGARKAVDEFMAQHPHPLFLHRIDYTGRLIVKPM